MIVIAVVVLAALYMRHGMVNRNKKTTAATETSKIGVGPATTVEKGLLSDQTRSGLDTGQSHVPVSLNPRSSITATNGAVGSDGTSGTSSNVAPSSSLPTLEYRPSPIATSVDGSMSFAEQRRVEEYKRESEAIEAPTSVKGHLPGEIANAVSQATTDPLQSIQNALLNARAAQGSTIGLQPTIRPPEAVKISERSMSARTSSQETNTPEQMET